MGKHLTQKERDRIVALYRKGWRRTDIARKVERSTTAVTETLLKAGIARTAGRNMGPRRPPQEKQVCKEFLRCEWMTGGYTDVSLGNGETRAREVLEYMARGRTPKAGFPRLVAF